MSILLLPRLKELTSCFQMPNRNQFPYLLFKDVTFEEENDRAKLQSKILEKMNFQHASRCRRASKALNLLVQNNKRRFCFKVSEDEEAGISFILEASSKMKYLNVCRESSWNDPDEPERRIRIRNLNRIECARFVDFDLLLYENTSNIPNLERIFFERNIKVDAFTEFHGDPRSISRLIELAKCRTIRYTSNCHVNWEDLVFMAADLYDGPDIFSMCRVDTVNTNFVYQALHYFTSLEVSEQFDPGEESVSLLPLIQGMMEPDICLLHFYLYLDEHELLFGDEEKRALGLQDKSKVLFEDVTWRGNLWGFPKRANYSDEDNSGSDTDTESTHSTDDETKYIPRKKTEEKEMTPQLINNDEPDEVIRDVLKSAEENEENENGLFYNPEVFVKPKDDGLHWYEYKCWLLEAPRRGGYLSLIYVNRSVPHGDHGKRRNSNLLFGLFVKGTIENMAANLAHRFVVDPDDDDSEEKLIEELKKFGTSAHDLDALCIFMETIMSDEPNLVFLCPRV